MCSSRCDKGFPCPNKHEVAEKVDHQIEFPPYGGALVQGDTKVLEDLSHR